MRRVVDVIYEKGVLRPVMPLEGVAEGEKLSVVVFTFPTAEDIEEDKQEAQFLKEMEEEGLLDTHNYAKGPPPTDFEPLAPIGKPLSEMIIEGRR